MLIGRKQKSILILSVMLCIMYVFSAFGAAGGFEPSEGVLSEEHTNNVELQLSYGYRNTAKRGRFLPVRMTVNNGAFEAVNGKIELYMLESSDMVYCYEYPVEIPANGTYEVKGNVSIGNGVGELLAVLKDENGETLCEESVNLNIDASGSEVLIGLISDNTTSLNFMSGVSLNNTSLKARTVSLNADELPDTEEGLDLLDLIVISDYNVNLLGEDIIEVIWNWVENGGTLLLGTGARHNPIGDFKDYLPYTEIGSPEIRPVNMGVEYSNEGPEGAVLNLPVCSIYIEGGTEKLSSDDISILTTIKAGAGTVGICAYDLCDISEFCKEQLSYTDKLLTSLVGGAGMDRPIREAEAGRDEYSEITSLINEGNVESFPNLSLYLLAAAAYILLAGPGLYVFLKQRSLNIMYGPAVLAVSVVAAAMVWFMGSGTRFAGPFINFAAIKEISADGENETDFIGLSSPYNRRVRIGLKPEYTVRPVISGENSGKRLTDAVYDTTLKRIDISYGSELTYIETENLKPFSESAFELFKSEETETGSDVSAELYIFDGGIEGSVHNNGDKDLTDVTLLLYGAALKVGSIKAGESRQMTDEELVFSPTGTPYITGSYITGLSESEESGERSEYMRDLAKTGLIEYYLENSLGNYYSGAKLLAFSEGDDRPDSLISEGTDCYGTTLLVTDADTKLSKDGQIYRSGLAAEPKLISGEYSVYNNTTQGNAAVVLEYSLGTDVAVTSLKLNGLSDEFYGIKDREKNALTSFSGNIAFYNYTTSSYDNIESGRLSFSGEELLPYLSPGNTITVRYIPKESTDQKAAVFLPMPWITGVKL